MKIRTRKVVTNKSGCGNNSKRELNSLKKAESIEPRQPAFNATLRSIRTR